MTTTARLRVLVLGNSITVRRLTECVTDAGMDLVSFTEFPEALVILKQEKFDLAVIDSQHNEARLAIQSIAQLGCAPVALLIRENETNWKNLRSWDVDGFVPEESGKVEFVARIKAISRRASLASKSSLMRP